jgi:hypothetical protein
MMKCRIRATEKNAMNGMIQDGDEIILTQKYWIQIRRGSTVVWVMDRMEVHCPFISSVDDFLFFVDVLCQFTGFTGRRTSCERLYMAAVVITKTA